MWQSKRLFQASWTAAVCLFTVSFVGIWQSKEKKSAFSTDEQTLERLVLNAFWYFWQSKMSFSVIKTDGSVFIDVISSINRLKRDIPAVQLGRKSKND